MKKTPIQKLIDEISELQRHGIMSAKNEYQNGYLKGLLNVKQAAKELLEKEKQEIIEAHKRGERVMGKSERAEQYYNETFNN